MHSSDDPKHLVPPSALLCLDFKISHPILDVGCLQPQFGIILLQADAPLTGIQLFINIRDPDPRLDKVSHPADLRWRRKRFH